MYDSDLSITTSLLTSSVPYSGERPMKSTNLQTEFLLQIRKQQEDSATPLASNRPQHKDMTEKKTDRKERK